MSLEDLLEPVLAVKKYTWDVADEQILRQYTKATKWWEENVGNRYFLASAVYLSLIPIDSIVETLQYKPVPLVGLLENSLAVGSILTMAFDLPLTFAVLMSKIIHSRYSNINSEMAVEPVEHLSKVFGRQFRLPLVGLTAAALGHSLGYFPDQHWLHGYAFLGPILFTSMYVKDADENILKKEPFWKKAYGTIKEKFTPPVPVQSYNHPTTPHE